MISTKVSSKGQITLPRRIRQALQVKPGDRVGFEIGDGSVLLRSMGPCGASALAGTLGRYRRNRANAGEVREAVKKEAARAAAQEG